MNEYKLILNDEYTITDFENSEIEISYALKDIVEFATRKTSFSKTISIPITPQTTAFFKSADMINDISFDTSKKVKAELFEDEVSILRGSMYLENIYPNNKYEIIVAKDDLNIFVDMAEKDLSELHFEDNRYSHKITKQHIYDNFHNINTGSGINYLFLQNDNEYKYGYLFTQDFTSYYPSVCAKELFEKIIFDNGYTYSISENVSKYLDELYLPYNGGLEKFTTTYNYLKSHFEPNRTNSSYVQFSNGLHKNQIYYYLEDSDYNYQGNGAKETKTSLSAKVSGIYQFDFTVKARLDTTDADEKETIKFVLKNGFNETVDLGELEIGNTAKSETFQSEPIFIEFNNLATVCVECDDNSKVQIYQNDTSINGYIQNYLFEGNKEININNVLPVNYKQKDFFNDILKAFNLHVYSDLLEDRKLIFETFDDFNTEEILDWSEKLDSNSMNFKDLTYKLPNKHTFGFLDSTDIYNKDFKTRYDKTFSTLSVLNNNELAAQKEDKITLKSSSTPVIRMNDYVFISNVFEKAGKTSFKPKMLFVNQFDLTNTSLSELFTSDNNYTAKDYTKFVTGTAYYNGDIENSELTFSFDNSKTYYNNEYKDTFSNNTLYNKFYKSDVEPKINGNFKLVECELLLDKYDINQSNFKKLIYIENDEIGSAYYRINEIKNYKNSNTLCKVVLVKINDVVIAHEPTIKAEQIALSDASIVEADKNSYSGGSSSSSSSNVDLSKYYDKAETNTLLSEYYKEEEAKDYIDAIANNTVKKTGEESQTIEGNLLVTGNILAFADDGTIGGSIFDNLPLASTTSKGIAQFDPNNFDVVNGVVSVSKAGLDETELATYLTSNNYATQNWVTTRNYLTYQDISNYATQDWVTDKNYLTTHQDISAYAKTLDVWTKSNIPNLDKITIDEFGNLLVPGNVISYSDGQSGGSIFDNLPITSTTSKGIAQFSDSYFTVNNGVVSIKDGVGGGLDEAELASYLTTNKYITDSYSKISNWDEAYNNMFKLERFDESGNKNLTPNVFLSKEDNITSGYYISYVSGANRLKLRSGYADDSGKLGNIAAANYARIDTPNTFGNQQTIKTGSDSNLVLQDASGGDGWNLIDFIDGNGTRQAKIGIFGSSGFQYSDANGDRWNIYHSGNSNKSDVDWTTRFLTSHGLATLNHGLIAGLGDVEKFRVTSDGTKTTGKHLIYTNSSIVDALQIRKGSYNAGGVGISFSDQTSEAQVGYLRFYHSDSDNSVGCGSVFKFSSTEAHHGVVLENTEGTSNFYVGTKGVWHAGNSGTNAIDWKANSVDVVNVGLRHPTSYENRFWFGYTSDNHKGLWGATIKSTHASYTNAAQLVLDINSKSIYSDSDIYTKGAITAENRLKVQSGSYKGDGGFDNVGLILDNTHATTGESAVSYKNAGTSGTGSNYWIHGLNQSNLFKWAYGTSFTDGNAKLVLDTSGNLTATGNVQSYSDERIKDNIKPIENATELIKQFDGVRYTRKDLEDKKRIHIGFRAQDVERVLPELIETQNDEMKTKTMNYAQYTAVLHQGLNETNNRVDELEKQNKELLRKIEVLEKRINL
ncbi:endosialidase-like protein [Ancylomarina subtilis]|uniref:Endosialidase-like protein n=1 Tax=Ancylomarina subtilis TaxID=1639035 RepID=A0A4Q7VK69_9BACT|nr:tail fiber domain-containing protein [Ancylomarina subtilis]RZT96631.1 endosialidase-like protein [Ancylomarina subtilis]